MSSICLLYKRIAPDPPKMTAESTETKSLRSNAIGGVRVRISRTTSAHRSRNGKLKKDPSTTTKTKPEKTQHTNTGKPDESIPQRHNKRKKSQRRKSGGEKKKTKDDKNRTNIRGGKTGIDQQRLCRNTETTKRQQRQRRQYRIHRDKTTQPIASSSRRRRTRRTRYKRTEPKRERDRERQQRVAKRRRREA